MTQFHVWHANDDDEDDDDLHPIVDEMYSLGHVVAHVNGSLVDRSFPADVTPVAITARVTWSDQTNARKLQLAALLDRLFCAIV